MMDQIHLLVDLKSSSTPAPVITCFVERNCLRTWRKSQRDMCFLQMVALLHVFLKDKLISTFM